MDKTVQDFCNSHRIGVLSILQDDNTIRSSSLHYANTEDPLQFIFLTGRDSHKCRPLTEGKDQHASLVIGFSEEEFKTIQAEGKVAIIGGGHLEQAWEIYLQKFPQRADLKEDDDMVLLRFTPTWWRYRDYKAKPLLEMSSNS